MKLALKYHEVFSLFFEKKIPYFSATDQPDHGAAFVGLLLKAVERWTKRN